MADLELCTRRITHLTLTSQSDSNHSTQTRILPASEHSHCFIIIGFLCLLRLRNAGLDPSTAKPKQSKAFGQCNSNSNSNSNSKTETYEGVSVNHLYIKQYSYFTTTISQLSKSNESTGHESRSAIKKHWAGDAFRPRLLVLVCARESPSG